MIFTLTGMKHSGKTSAGRELAAQLSLPLYDLDDELEKLYDSRRSCTFREIYRREGKEGFMLLEAEAAEKLAGEFRESECVLSLGGGAIENNRVVSALKPDALFVYLKLPVDILYDRIKTTGLPAFLSRENPYDDFRALYIRRTLLLEKNADIVIEAEGLTPAEIGGKIRKQLQERGYAR